MCRDALQIPALRATISNRHYLSARGTVIGVLFTAGEHTVAATAAVLTKTEYWHKDHLGSSGAMTDASGSITNRYAYDPWLNAVRDSNELAPAGSERSAGRD
jgi:hypothetical protein